MAEVAAPLPSGPMQDVETTAPPSIPVSEEPENACETLYIQNLNEKIKTDVLKASLRGLFKSYGEVLDVVAHSNLRMRGQAFVSFASKDSASKALKEQISFARTRSDAVVKKVDGGNFEAHKARRDEHKKATRYSNPLKQKLRAKRMAADMDGAAAMPAAKRPNVQMPDEYLPPNKILFLQNLPENVTKDQLIALFSQYPNLYEVRLIPTKKDIAFVEFLDEGSSGTAKDALHNYKLDGENKIKGGATKCRQKPGRHFPDLSLLRSLFSYTRPATPESDEKRTQERTGYPAHWRGKDMGIRQPKWTANSMIGKNIAHDGLEELSLIGFTAGAGGGLVASIATCPLDVVKTKLQAQRAIQGQRGYLGIMGTVKDILTENGFRGLYRGLGPTILGYLPTWAIYFAVYDGIKGFFGEPPMGGAPKKDQERLYPAAQPKGYQPVAREHPWSLHILSAMTAGAASTICTNPLWVIKTRFMTQTKDEIRYKHTLDAALTIYRTEGPRAFYRGLVPSLLGICHVAVQFPLYEQLKVLALANRDAEGESDKPLTSQAILLCSAISKMTASIATYPHEVVRTRLQTQRRPLADDMSSDGMIKQHQRRGVIYTTTKLIRKEGWTGLYRGLSINLIRTVPNSAVTMLTQVLRRFPATYRASSKLFPSQLLSPNRSYAIAQGPSPNDAFANGTNAYYADQMYRHWRQDPKSVHPSWDAYFSGLDSGLPSSQAFSPPPAAFLPHPADGAPALHANGGAELDVHLKTQLLVRAYQVRGHHVAELDPLGIMDPDLADMQPPELELSRYGFTERDLEKDITLGPGILPHFATDDRKTMKLREVIALCKRIYCGAVGIQYVHIPDKEQCDWIRERVEVPKPWNYSVEEKRMILDRLIWSESFEKFMASKYPNEKRFGLEGCEALIPGMKALIDRSVDNGIKHITIGMPHRGRLNVLANVIRKPIEAILNEFSGTDLESPAGDVKYHLGANYVRPTPSGKKVSLSLVANPSHLEAEDPVVLGKTRAIQHFENDEAAHSTAMGVLLHGDAAFAGQGVVYETMGMHNLPSYGTGGTIHLIVNNQIGFTTDPRFSRSTPYPSDIAKSIDAPIFHVNGDNVEAVNFVCQLAADYRAKWKKDVVIDIVCYRRHGHNETDQPSFTQPRMYQAIAKQPTPLTQYTKFLVGRGTFTEKDIEEHKKWVWGMLETAAAAAKDYVPTSKEWLSASWQGFPSPKQLAEQTLPTRPTGTDVSILERVGKAISQWPTGFTPHKNLARILASRGKTVEEGKNIDWSTAEALAFGSLALEKIHVRVSGQDVERGTFSQRHAVIHDQNNEQQYIPLNDLGSNQARFVVCNSSLSEYGTLGFELGYSLVSPDSLTVWEAQFGDFANNAQCIIDQFVAAGERKWLQRTGLVMSLPHGYDGQGPEHSSGRIERFLQLCDDHPHIFPTPEKIERQHQDCNMQVVYPTTPANYFHVLRRQIHRDFRKPLIVFFSKSLLRHPRARSDLSEMVGETHFQRYIPEPFQEALVAPEEIKRHILCTGQVYHALLQEREDRGIKDVAISRIEQLSPFPYDQLTPHLDMYPNADLLWCQEEPLNNGAWSYIGPRIYTAAGQTQHHKGKYPYYAGRGPTSSVATGSKAQHKKEIAMFLHDAFDLSNGRD
ncbi:hypothetical protein H0H92_001080 [Tricholoma furcatifolium]|nr:hypothetical protein H0H92_001080 [Tricholoma furcatifolium]